MKFFQKNFRIALSVYAACSLSAALFLSLSNAPLYAQASDSTTKTTLPKSTEPAQIQAPMPVDYFAFGLGYGLGDASFDRATIMVSTAYSHRFSSLWGIEIAGHYLGRTFINNFGGNIAASGQQDSFTGDASMMFRPFGVAEDLAAQTTTTPSGKFSLGIGPSVRVRSLSLYSSVSVFQSQPLITSYPNTVSIGGHFKAEYAFPLSNSSELGLRGQIHLFAPPFVPQGQQPELITTRIPFFQGGGGSVSLGGFLRFGLSQMPLEERLIALGEVEPASMRREPVPFEKSAQNLIFAEFGGNGIFGSVNYERMLSDVVSIRAGLGYFATQGRIPQSGFSVSNPTISVPVLGAYHLLLSANDHIELGGGITTAVSVQSSEFLQSFQPENLRGPVFVVPTALLGYRYQPREGGVMVRLAVTPLLFEWRIVQPWAGVSIGYAF
jgi:hypothetical protein